MRLSFSRVEIVVNKLPQQIFLIQNTVSHCIGWIIRSKSSDFNNFCGRILKKMWHIRFWNCQPHIKMSPHYLVKCKSFWSFAEQQCNFESIKSGLFFHRWETIHCFCLTISQVFKFYLPSDKTIGYLRNTHFSRKATQFQPDAQIWHFRR